MSFIPWFLSILLFLNIGTLLTYSLSKHDHLIDNHYELISEDEEVHFRSLRKRESEPQPVILKKPTSEKKVPVKLSAKDKDVLKENVTDAVSAVTPKPTELVPKGTKPSPSDVSVTTTECPDLPSDFPKGYTLDDEGNTTQHFIYYNATSYNETAAMNLWVDLDSLPMEKVTKHVMLSSSHRRASTVSLPFDFPFYGHKIRNITIATGGFLYTGDYMHTWLAATQYIAPLMANFDTSIHNESTIKYADCGDNFTVQWEKVYLQDKTQEGPFTFQVTLHKSGDIAFVYQTVPIFIKEINDDHHPVKVGLSDAYIIEKTVVYIRKKTIFEYHRADVSHFDIQNYTSIYFTALPTCQNYSDCDSCMSADNRFECLWCDAVGRCSSGLDRHRQDWINAKCEDLKPTDVKCKAPTPTSAFVPTNKPSLPTSFTPLPPASSTNSTSNATTSSEVVVTTYATASVPPKLVTLRPDKKGQYVPAARISDEDEQDEAIHKGSVGAGAVIAILIIICSVLGFGIWIGYAYKYPQSPSGQLLIRYRPSQWRFRNGEARYTAASLHI